MRLNTRYLQHLTLGLLLAGGLVACGNEEREVIGSNGSVPSATQPEDDGAATLQGSTDGGSSRIAQGFEFGGPVSDQALADYHVRMDVAIDGADVGSMFFEFWPEIAPITVRNFFRLTDEEFYDGLTFHRVMRDFMVQGGDPNGDGSGTSPHGTIPAEFHTQLDYGHRYGVISMARLPGQPNSASSGFFLCCVDASPVWRLDGEYASFGRLTQGVSTLEAIADVKVGPVTLGAGSPATKPYHLVRITRAEVLRGQAPSGEEITQPLEPGEEDEVAIVRKVVLRQLVIGFDECTLRGIERSKEEAAALASTVAELARAEDSDFKTLVLEYCDLPRADFATDPGRLRLLNDGVRDSSHARREHELIMTERAKMDEARQRVDQGSMTAEAFTALSISLNQARSEFKSEFYWRPFGAAERGVAAQVFGMHVGEVRIIPHSQTESPKGYTVIKRFE
jgi:peptidyl-prolyl cis-trans isomerase B (cyclophilin B)